MGTEPPCPTTLCSLTYVDRFAASPYEAQRLLLGGHAPLERQTDPTHQKFDIVMTVTNAGEIATSRVKLLDLTS